MAKNDKDREKEEQRSPEQEKSSILDGLRPEGDDIPHLREPRVLGVGEGFKSSAETPSPDSVLHDDGTTLGGHSTPRPRNVFEAILQRGTLEEERELKKGSDEAWDSASLQVFSSASESLISVLSSGQTRLSPEGAEAVKKYLLTASTQLFLISEDESASREECRFSNWSVVEDEILYNALRVFGGALVRLTRSAAANDVAMVLCTVADSLKETAAWLEKLTSNSNAGTLPSVETGKDVKSFIPRVEALEQRAAELQVDANSLVSELGELDVPKAQESEVASLVERVREAFADCNPKTLASTPDFNSMNAQQLVSWLKSNGLSYGSIARGLDLRVSHVSRIASGDIKQPRLPLLTGLRNLAEDIHREKHH